MEDSHEPGSQCVRHSNDKSSSHWAKGKPTGLSVTSIKAYRLERLFCGRGSVLLALSTILLHLIWQTDIRNGTSRKIRIAHTVQRHVLFVPPLCFSEYQNCSISRRSAAKRIDRGLPQNSSSSSCILTAIRLHYHEETNETNWEKPEEYRTGMLEVHRPEYPLRQSIVSLSGGCREGGRTGGRGGRQKRGEGRTRERGRNRGGAESHKSDARTVTH